MGNGSKIPYTWAQYDKDIKNIIVTLRLKEIEVDGVICIHRGSLPIGTSLSNILNVPLSIIKFQTRDGDDKDPYFILDERKPNGVYIIVDDIIDSGLTMNKILDFIDIENDSREYIISSLFGSFEKTKNIKQIICVREIPGWVVFPWEKLNTIRCNECGYGQKCKDDPENMIHCDINNKSYHKLHYCSWGTRNVPKISKFKKEEKPN